ncbi:MAG: DUF997 family protein [Pirellulales bacterium]|nr:DUF997 family protein [Pirellulales bacterium]
MTARFHDPLLASARREAIITGVIYVITMCYSVGYCLAFGYDRSIDDLTFVLGFPDWVFWGIVVPWIAAFVVSSVFAMCYMTDEPFGEDVGDEWADEFGEGQP